MKLKSWVAVVIPTDVADATAVGKAAVVIEEQLGPIDIWVNNAMTSVRFFHRSEKMKPDEYKRVTDVTYLGVVHGTMAALKRMLARNRGPIVEGDRRSYTVALISTVPSRKI